MEIISLIILIISGLGAGVVTGSIGASAVVIVAPILVTFLGYSAYDAIGISLIVDVFASGVSTIIYKKNKNILIKKGIFLAGVSILGAFLGSYFSQYIPSTSLGNITGIITFIVGIQFVRKPITKSVKSFRTKINTKWLQENERFSMTIFGLLIGLICGVVGAGGGLFILMVLTFVFNFDTKKAIGTSVFIMTLTALSGGVSHLSYSAINWFPIFIVSAFGIIGAVVAAKITNISSEDKVSKIIGIMLTILGISMILITHI